MAVVIQTVAFWVLLLLLFFGEERGVSYLITLN
jgi:hypothetical protein